MDETKHQINNQEAVAGQVGENHGTVNIHVGGRRKKQRSPSAPDRFWTVPYLRNQVFTGREEVLHELHLQLTTARATALTQPQAISGLGGIGKTQVAIEYAYRYGEEYHDVFWIDAATRETLVSGFLELAVLLNLPQQQEQDQNKVIAAIKQWFLSHRQWLLIFDNADDLTLAEEFLPTSNTGYIILTTRYQTRRTFAMSLNIETMSIQEGALLLLRRANLLDMNTPLEQAKSADRTLAESTATLMDGLPLALDQAGAYIEETQCTLAAYLERYRREQTKLLQRRGDVGKAHPDPVATTWSLSFEKAKQLNPLAADLLQFCAFLAPDDIPEQLILDGASQLGSHLQSLMTIPSLLDEAIGTLLRFSLVKRKRDEQTITVHRLVQAVQRTSMDNKTQQLWARRAILALNLAFPEVDYNNQQKCQLYLPQVQNCESLVDQWKFAFPEAAQLFMQTGEYLTKDVQYKQAEGYYQQALAIREKVFGSTHPHTAETLHHLAHLYEDQGKYKQADNYHQRELAISEKIQGAEHLDTATSLHCMGTLYRKWGKYEQAEGYYQRALAIRQKVLGPEHPETAKTLHHLAHLYEDQNKYEQADNYHQRELAIREKIQGVEHFDTANSLRCMGNLYRKWGKYEQAEDYYQRALTICQKVLGPEHPETARILHDFAHLYEDQNKYEQAISYHQRELAICEKVLDSEHPQKATSLHCMGTLYRKWGKYEQAEDYYQRALAIRQKVLGPEHPETAKTLHHLAHLYEAQGKYEQAASYHQRELAIREKIQGAEHPSTANSLACMGTLYRKWGKFEEAESYYRRALAIREKVLGPEHPQTAALRHLLTHL